MLIRSLNVPPPNVAPPGTLRFTVPVTEAANPFGLKINPPEPPESVTKFVVPSPRLRLSALPPTFRTFAPVEVVACSNEKLPCNVCPPTERSTLFAVNVLTTAVVGKLITTSGLLGIVMCRFATARFELFTSTVAVPVNVRPLKPASSMVPLACMA